MDYKKIGVRAWPVPTTREWGFLGLTGYHRKFIRYYGKITKPMRDLLRKNCFIWNKRAQRAFEEFKGCGEFDSHFENARFL